MPSSTWGRRSWSSIPRGTGATSSPATMPPRRGTSRRASPSSPTRSSSMPRRPSWAASYDGRNKEPVTLPAKFPLVLAHGAEGIAVGLACKILPHNFNELIDACIAVLKKEPFEIFPDFPQGGIADVTDYNDGLRGGRIKVRARIEKTKSKELIIREIPFGTTASSLATPSSRPTSRARCASPRSRTAPPSTSRSTSISPPAPTPTRPCRRSTPSPTARSASRRTPASSRTTSPASSASPRFCAQRQADPRPASGRSSRSSFTNSRRNGTSPASRNLHRKAHLPAHRGLRNLGSGHPGDLEGTAPLPPPAPPRGHRGRHRPTHRDPRSSASPSSTPSRPTNISAALRTRSPRRKKPQATHRLHHQVVRGHQGALRKGPQAPHRALHLRPRRRQTGRRRERHPLCRPQGRLRRLWGLKRDEPVCKCSRMDDIIAFSRDGTMRVVKVAEKAFVGKGQPPRRRLQPRRDAKIYNMIYRDGRGGKVMVKRFRVEGVTREKLYDLTGGAAGTRVLWFSEHDTEEDANLIVRVHLKSDLKLRNFQIDFRFANLDIKGRGAKGNILTKHPVDRVSRIAKAEQDEIEVKHQRTLSRTEPPKKPEPPKKAAALKTKEGDRKRIPAEKAPTKQVPTKKRTMKKATTKKAAPAKKPLRRKPPPRRLLRRRPPRRRLLPRRLPPRRPLLRRKLP
jgi:topoisomerase-4 subunit A